MKRINGWIQSSIVVAVFLGLFAANAALWGSPILGGILLGGFLLIGAARLSSLWNSDGHFAERGWFGACVFVSVLMLSGAVAYYVAELTPLLSHALVAGIFAATTMIPAAKPGRWQRLREWIDERREGIPGAAAFAFAAGLLCVAFALKLISDGTILEPLRTPWASVSPSVFVLVFAAGLFLFALLLRGTQRPLSLSLACGLLFAIVSLGAFAYPLGFGFDPHIHQATEAHIAEFGTITPKPLYYVGQYALVVMVNHSFHLPIREVDRWLLPVLMALLLPIAAYASGVRLLKNRKTAAFAAGALFLLPLAPFVATTPQGIGDLWLLLLILASVPRLLGDRRPPLWALGLIAVATLLIHPIAGIPAMVYFALLVVQPVHAPERLRVPAKIATGLIVALGALALPVSFALNAIRSGTGSGLDLAAITPQALLASLNLSLFFENRFNPLLDFAYLWGFNALAATVLVALIAAWRFRKGTSAYLLPLLFMAAVLFANYLLLSTAVDFSFLIDYERDNYAERLLPILAFFLLPLVMLFFGRIAARLENGPVSLRAFTVVLLAALAASSFYLAYPRDDAYGRGRGFNVGQSDIAAVVAIDAHAEGKSYAVLADQAVSAAAVRELGFKRYWGDLFFYPIPTGGDLYEQFLAMNERPSRDVAEKAGSILVEHCGGCARPQRIYFVVNDYWWQAPRIVETAKTQADGWFAVGGSAVHVFWWDL
jgi:hypothetical protein